MTLFPNLANQPKVKRRLLMLALFPIVWAEANINFFIAAYYCWAQEH